MTTIQDLSKAERDILRLIQSKCHIGSKNYNTQMKRYISKFGSDGTAVFDLSQTYQKIKLAARVIAGIPDINDVIAISSRNYGQRAVVKFSKFTGCSVNNSTKWTPGSLTNYETKQYKEPKLIIVADPHADFKAIKESSYVNIPVIALCDAHHSLQYVDIAIPCNTTNTHSVSMVFWMIAREINVLMGKLDQNDDEWSTCKEAMVDLFYSQKAEGENKVKKVYKKIIEEEELEEEE